MVKKWQSALQRLIDCEMNICWLAVAMWAFLHTFDSWHYVQKIWNLISYFVSTLRVPVRLCFVIQVSAFIFSFALFFFCGDREHFRHCFFYFIFFISSQKHCESCFLQCSVAAAERFYGNWYWSWCCCECDAAFSVHIKHSWSYERKSEWTSERTYINLVYAKMHWSAAIVRIVYAECSMYMCINFCNLLILLMETNKN